MSILGNRVRRREDPAFLTGGDRYLDNLPLDGALRVVYVRSTIAHARIVAVDTDAALDAPGVVAVFTAADVDLAPLPPAMETMHQAMTRPWLADGVVRFVGEAVAAVVAQSWAEAVDAAELVFVDYDPLPAVVDPRAALTGDVVLFPEAGTNVVCELSVPEGGPSDDLFAGCEVVVRATLDNHRLAPCPLEVQAAASRWEPDGRLTHWSSTQTPHMVKGALTAAYALPADQVRVIAPDVGGGFGAKFGSYPEALLLPWIARRLGRPVRWAETRSESMVALGHGRAQLQEVELGGTRDGQLLAYRLTAVQDSGAYPLIGAALPGFTALMTSGVYAIPRVEFSSRSVVTTTNPIVAYRGAGRPEACAAVERAMDLYAAEIGQDPTEVRRRNFIPADQFPFTTAVGTCYDSGDYERALDLVLEGADYERLRKQQAKRRAEGGSRQIGIGVSSGRWRSPPRGGRWCAPDRPPTARATPPPSPCWPPSISGCPWRRSTSSTATPTPCRRASARSAPAPCSSAGRPSAWPRSRSWNRPGTWPPSCWRPIPTTSSSPAAPSTWPVPRPSPGAGPRWRPPPGRTGWRPSSPTKSGARRSRSAPT